MSRMRETGFKKLAGNTAVTSISPDRDVEFKYFQDMQSLPNVSKVNATNEMQSESYRSI